MAQNLFSTYDSLRFLCQRCRHIRLNEMFKPNFIHDSSGMRYYLPIGNSYEPWLEPSCPMCRLFGAILPPPKQRLENYGICMVAAGQIIAPDKQYDLRERSNFLGIISKPVESRLTPRDVLEVCQSFRSSGLITKVDPLVRKISSKAPIDLMLSWLQNCQQRHTACTQERRRGIVATRLVDCDAMKVVDAPAGAEYVALSYVWGEQSDRTSLPQHDGDLLQNMPQTIADAIQVTKDIQKHYLWVDQLCMPGKRSFEFSQQIQQMDSIYHDAELVIIAAAGHDSHYGLPGVSTRKRIPQPHEMIGGHEFVSLLRHPQELIANSTWNTRAWTYQESICARRRLVFTDEQVVFVCQADHQQETVCSARSDIYQCSFPAMWCNNTRPWQISHHIAEYSRKKLTYETDALRAILGVVRALRDGDEHATHICGIPILPSVRTIDEDSFDVAPQVSSRIILGLCWTHASPGRRRTMFPSWSWTGWTVAISPNPPEWSERLTWVSEDVRISQVRRYDAAINVDRQLSLVEAPLMDSGHEVTTICPVLQVDCPTIDLWIDSPVNGVEHDTTCCRV